MKIKKIAIIIIYLLFFIGIFGSGALALDEFKNGQVCPVLTGIPACYIIFLCFLFLLLLYTLRKKDIYFYALAFVPISIALYGTVFQIIGTIECPKTSSGIPMCFISLALFSGLCICKYVISKKK